MAHYVRHSLPSAVETGQLNVKYVNVPEAVLESKSDIEIKIKKYIYIVVCTRTRIYTLFILMF